MRKPVLHVPNYSMRSYETGKYALLKDGNLKVHLNRMDLDIDYLVIPSFVSDLEEFLSFNFLNKDRIIMLHYFTNAAANKTKFWSNEYNLNIVKSFDGTVVTDLTGYPGDNFINFFPVTKLPDYPRDYVDKFWQSDVESMHRANKTFVLNSIQKYYICKEYGYLAEKVVVDQRCVSAQYFDKVLNSNFEKIEIEKNAVFFPFRLSDKAYKFDELVKEYKDRIIYITDPNESYNANYENVKVVKPSKAQYYDILKQKPTIPYYENPEIVFHAGLADFLYFGCNIICKHKISALNDVLVNDIDVYR